MSVSRFRRHWRVFAIIGALVFVYAPVLVHLSRTWWVDENYSHGLLIPFVIGYILWTQRHRLLKNRSTPSSFWGGLVILLALFALWAGVAGAELYMQRISLVLMLVGVVLYLRGAGFLRVIWMPLGLLLLAIPIPAILFNQVAFPLQLFASRCAVWSMRLFDIPVLRQGNVIELVPLNSLETKKLEVVEACSGIRSLMTLITLALIVAYFTNRGASSDPPNSVGSETQTRLKPLKTWGLWRSGLVVLSAVPIAIFTNALRVSGTGILAHYYGTKVADGFFHSFSGWVTYMAAVLLLFSFAWVLDRFAALVLHDYTHERSALNQVNLLRPCASAPQLRQPEGTD